MWLRLSKFMINSSSGSEMGLSLDSLSDEILFMTMLPGVRLQHGSKAGTCTSASSLKCLLSWLNLS